MKVLVTGGTGVIGAGAIPALLQRGHTVRLLSRGAAKDAIEWPERVEPFTADVSDPESLRGAAEGCGAIVHITGIAEEHPPEQTFEAINVQGTANLLEEAHRSGSPRFVFISSLGADRGKSAYHRSKRRAETYVEQYKGPWTILRPGAVYGPGDEVISLLMQWVRSLPVIPVVGDGEQPFQPIWYEDFGAAIAAAVEREDLGGRTLELAGKERTSTHDLIDRIGRVVGSLSLAIPTPVIGAALAAKFGKRIDTEFPLTEAKLTMLLEGNVVRNGNALTEVFAIEPVKLDKGLKLLSTRMPELTPDEGVGPLQRKRFRAEIEGAEKSAEELIEIFRRDYREILPIDFGVEGEAEKPLEVGDTVSGELPLRGHIQIRVEQAEPRLVTFATIEGHPIAGVVQFLAEGDGAATSFEVRIHARAASWFDLLTLKLGGEAAQQIHWELAVERMVERSGGRAPRGVEEEKIDLSESEASSVERWVDSIIAARKRAEAQSA